MDVFLLNCDSSVIGVECERYQLARMATA